MEEEGLIFKLSPSYNFIYELAMPTGRKIAKSLLLLMVFIIIYIAVTIGKNYIPLDGLEYMKDIDVIGIFNIVGIILIIIQFIVFISKTVLQIVQYKSTRYSFYDDHMIYEDSFLNQHKKVIRYNNVREIEIRRMIWDRLNNSGVIIIYTNAENETSNGLILYSIKNTDYWYKKIDEVVHSDNSVSNEEQKKEIIKEKIIEEEENFKNSLKS